MIPCATDEYVPTPGRKAEEGADDEAKKDNSSDELSFESSNEDQEQEVPEFQ